MNCFLPILSLVTELLTLYLVFVGKYRVTVNHLLLVLYSPSWRLAAVENICYRELIISCIMFITNIVADKPCYCWLVAVTQSLVMTADREVPLPAFRSTNGRAALLRDSTFASCSGYTWPQASVSTFSTKLRLLLAFSLCHTTYYFSKLLTVVVMLFLVLFVTVVPLSPLSLFRVRSQRIVSEFSVSFSSISL